MYLYYFIILVDEKNRSGENQDIAGELMVNPLALEFFFNISTPVYKM
jgi:hypothetical protein